MRSMLCRPLILSAPPWGPLTLHRKHTHSDLPLFVMGAFGMVFPYNQPQLLELKKVYIYLDFLPFVGGKHTA